MKELKKLAWSVLGAALTAGVIAFFEYLGAHIGEVFSLAGMVAGARASLQLYNIHA